MTEFGWGFAVETRGGGLSNRNLETFFDGVNHGNHSVRAERAEGTPFSVAAKNP